MESLYFAFRRPSFGTIIRSEGTGPTRSRASFRTSFVTLNFFFLVAISTPVRALPESPVDRR